MQKLFENWRRYVIEQDDIAEPVAPDDEPVDASEGGSPAENIEQLAAVLAIIRPAKRGLMYKDWQDIMKEVWVRPTDGSYFFKKSHAVAYAQAIVVQMNLIATKNLSSNVDI